MSSPVVSAAGDRVAMVLYDQDRCAANVYSAGVSGVEQIADLASDQIVTDLERACVAFLPGGELAVWSVQNWDFVGTLGVYDIASGAPRFGVDIASEVKLELEDEEEFSLRVENTELVMRVEGDQLHVGAVGSVATVDLTQGEVSLREVPGAGAVAQVLGCGEGLVALDMDNRLFLA